MADVTDIPLNKRQDVLPLTLSACDCIAAAQCVERCRKTFHAQWNQQERLFTDCIYEATQRARQLHRKGYLSNAARQRIWDRLDVRCAVFDRQQDNRHALEIALRELAHRLRAVGRDATKERYAL